MKCKDSGILTYLLGVARLQNRSSAVEMEWTEGEHTRRKTKKIEKISDFLHP